MILTFRHIMNMDEVPPCGMIIQRRNRNREFSRSMMQNHAKVKIAPVRMLVKRPPIRCACYNARRIAYEMSKVLPEEIIFHCPA